MFVYYYTLLCTYLALDMESLKEERSPTVEQVTASGNRVAELQETCPKRICTGISNHASVGTATPVVIVAKCSEAAAQISVPKPSSTQDTCALPWSSDHISNDVCAPSHVSSIKDGCCSETDDEPNESFGVDTTTSDPDVSRRRNLRRKMLMKHCSPTDFKAFLADIADLFIQAGQNAVCLCMCLSVNQGGTNHNRCTQRLILHAQTY